jgi:predicted nucleic acid-binding protein
MIHLDTSVLIDALTGPRRLSGALRELLEGPELVSISSVVLFEWLQGPRLKEEIEAQEALFPAADSSPFGFAEAQIASRLYKSAGLAVAKPIWSLRRVPSPRRCLVDPEFG